MYYGYSHMSFKGIGEVIINSTGILVIFLVMLATALGTCYAVSHTIFFLLEGIVPEFVMAIIFLPFWIGTTFTIIAILLHALELIQH